MDGFRIFWRTALFVLIVNLRPSPLSLNRHSGGCGNPLDDDVIVVLSKYLVTGTRLAVSMSCVLKRFRNWRNTADGCAYKKHALYYNGFDYFIQFSFTLPILRQLYYIFQM